ncbi:hypothetical protein D3C84_1314820 [compost metagenome]
MQDEIDATIRATTTALGNGETLATECFAHQLLKLAPADAVDGFTRLGGGRHVLDELLTLGPTSN